MQTPYCSCVGGNVQKDINKSNNMGERKTEKEDEPSLYSKTSLLGTLIGGHLYQRSC